MKTAPNCNCSGCYGGPELFRHGAPVIGATEYLTITERDADRAFRAKVDQAVAESKRRAAAIKAAKLAK